MNLINRDVLAEYISENEKAFVYAIKHKDMTMLEDVILDIPIAYEVDKVVEQLESESARWQDSGDAYNDEKEKGVAIGFRKAIEIVKVGGVDGN